MNEQPPDPRPARGAIAVATLVLLQLGIAAYYWIADPRLAVALRPTWDVVGLALIVVAWSQLSPSRRADRAVAAGLTVAVFVTLAIAGGQGLLGRLFGRELILALDIAYVGALLKMLRDAETWWLFALILLALGAGVTAAIAGPYLGLRHLRRYLHRNPRRQLGLGAGGLAYLAVGAAMGGIHPPVAAEVVAQLRLVWNLKDPLAATARQLEEETAPNQTLHLPVGPAAEQARPRRIYVFVVESYGQVIYAEKDAYGTFPAFLAKQAARLRQAGYQARAKLLRAPVFGGGSWMADATFLCGAPITTQKRFVSLFQANVRCLPRILGEAGYRTVLAAPGTTLHEERFDRTYAFAASYFHDDFGYAGPRFGWSPMPDSFVVDFVHRKEVAARPDAPLFATMILTSSHAPWSHVPPVVAWDEIGDGAVYNRAQPRMFENSLIGGRQYQAGYQTSIEYSLDTIVSYLVRLPADDRSLVLVFGDHQPQQPVASRWRDSRLVPIHVLGRDAEVVGRFARFGYGEGLMPAAPAGEPDGHERLLGELISVLGGAP